MRRVTQLATAPATAAARKTAGGQQQVAKRMTSTSPSQEGAAAATGPKPGSLRGLPTTEFIYICGIFAITGSSAAYFVRPTLKWLLTSSNLGLGFSQLIGVPNPETASLINGPMTFRILYFTFMMPMYSLLLFTYGTIFGRGLFFRHFLVKMWSRMMPKSLHDRLKLVLVGV